MITIDNVTKESIKEHHLKWPQFLDHPVKLLEIDIFASGKKDIT